MAPTVVHVLRHGESLHNVYGKGYPGRDPPLTPAGIAAAKKIGQTLVNEYQPDLILISPMTRTIQTALNAFPQILSPSPSGKPLQFEIYADLREANDAECNKGVGQSALAANFPMLSPNIFAHLPSTWDYPPFTIESANERGERVRQHLLHLSTQGYKNVVIVTHRCFAAFLVQGPRLQLAELRSFTLNANPSPEQRIGFHCETGGKQDFGPTVLIPFYRNPPTLLLLNGFPGVGKFTICKALKKSLSSAIQFKEVLMIDNHSVIDIVIKTHEKHSAGYYSARKSVLRTDFFNKIVQTEGMLVIMTSVFAEDVNGIDQWQDHVSLCKERSFTLIQVNLSCNAEVNAERLVSEERLRWVETGVKMKQIKPSRLAELRDIQVMIDPKDHIEDTKDVVVKFFELDVTKLSAEASAEKLRDILGKSVEKQTDNE